MKIIVDSIGFRRIVKINQTVLNKLCFTPEWLGF